jgi:hypothetical protein
MRDKRIVFWRQIQVGEIPALISIAVIGVVQKHLSIALIAWFWTFLSLDIWLAEGHLLEYG